MAPGAGLTKYFSLPLPVLVYVTTNTLVVMSVCVQMIKDCCWCALFLLFCRYVKTCCSIYAKIEFLRRYGIDSSTSHKYQTAIPERLPEPRK